MALRGAIETSAAAAAISLHCALGPLVALRSLGGRGLASRARHGLELRLQFGRRNAKSGPTAATNLL